MSKNLEKARAVQAANRSQTLAERVEEVMTNDRVDTEFKRKLQYCLDEIARGRRDFPVTRRDELLREAARRFKKP